jgi:hypothetical protein
MRGTHAHTETENSLQTSDTKYIGRGKSPYRYTKSDVEMLPPASHYLRRSMLYVGKV